LTSNPRRALEGRGPTSAGVKGYRKSKDIAVWASAIGGSGWPRRETFVIDTSTEEQVEAVIFGLILSEAVLIDAISIISFGGA
jgi:hypothetical protein